MSNLTFPRNFLDFITGVFHIDDATINIWIRECVDELESDREAHSIVRSSGNTRVVVERGADEYRKYEVYVSRGYYAGYVSSDGKPVFDSGDDDQPYRF